ncbi:hypothetical protein MY11210_001565 [Beauveria gryllotalpidicola]
MHLLLLYALFAEWFTFGQAKTVTTFAPIPSAATGPPIGSEGYRLESFGGGAHMVTDGMYQAIFLVTPRSVVMVDAPPTIGHNILKAIRSLTPLPISHLVYSHAHSDHVGAANLLVDRDTIIIAHDLTAKELAEAPDPTRPMPSLTFKTTHTLHVDNQTLQLQYHGPVHEPGNIFIFAPCQKLLMLVDIVFPGWVPFSTLAEAKDVPFFIEAHDRILNYDFDHFVGGHLTRTGNRSDVQTQREYVQDLYDNCRQGLMLSAQPPNATNPVSAEAILPPIAKANPGNFWALYDGYLNSVAGYCADLTTKKWLGKLGAVDVYTFSHAFAMMESLRIDYGVLGPFGVQSAGS